jgi:hypothetical protein
MLSVEPPSYCSSIDLEKDEDEDTDTVELELLFIHDFFADETTYSIRESSTRNIVFSGPTYVPVRNAQWRVPIQLPPGNYTFEVYDKGANGLQDLDNLSEHGDGRWTLLAIMME